MIGEIKKGTEVVIIGGGIIGTSIAYSLAKKGKKDVVLIERKELASEASGANTASILTLVPPPRRVLLELATRTQDVLEHLSKDLERDIEYVTPRIIQIEEGHLKTYEGYCNELRKLGHPEVRIIGRDEIAELEPYLTPRPYGLLDPRGGHVNPLYLVTALGDKARELGVKVYEHTEVVSIKKEKGRVKSVVTDKGELEAAYIVNACGFWAPQIGEMVGLRVPITPLLSQMVVTEELPVRIVKSGSLSISSYFAADETAEKEMAYPAFKQMNKGELLLGVVESPGEDKWTTFKGIQAICQEAVTNFPILMDMRVNAITSYANLYAVTPDRLPILGLIKGLEGFIMATGFNDYGISLGYGAGEVISELICAGETSIPIGDCSFSRFA